MFISPFFVNCTSEKDLDLMLTLYFSRSVLNVSISSVKISVVSRLKSCVQSYRLVFSCLATSPYCSVEKIIYLIASKAEEEDPVS